MTIGEGKGTCELGFEESIRDWHSGDITLNQRTVEPCFTDRSSIDIQDRYLLHYLTFHSVLTFDTLILVTPFTSRCSRVGWLLLVVRRVDGD